MTATDPVWPPTDLANPFDLVVQDVHRLVPYRQLPSAPGTAYPGGTIVITEDDILAWVAQLSGDLMGRLAVGTELFRVDAVAWSQVYLMGRDAVSNGVASYWEAAFYPERAGVNDTAYSGVLWQRYLRSVDAVDALLQGLLEQGGSESVDDVPIYVEGAGFVWSLFPPVAFPDDLRW